MACSKVVTKLENILECAVCEEIVQKPRRLACFHSFCKTCINKQPKENEENEAGIHCPVCKAFSRENQIKQSFLVDELLDAYCTAESGVSKCQQCSVDDSKWNCLDCKLEVCDKCKGIHLKIPLLRNHRIVDRSNAEDIVVDRLVFCKVHEDEPIKFNCQTCESLICLMCNATQHKNHESETVQENLNRVLPEIKENTSKLLHKVEKIDQDCADILSKIEQINKSYEKCSTEARNNLNEVIEMAKACHAEIIKELDSKKEKELAKLKWAKSDMENKKKEYIHICDWVNTSIESVKGVTLLSEMQDGLFTRVKNAIKHKPNKPLYLDTPLLVPNIKKEAMQDIVGHIKYQSLRLSTSLTRVGSGKTPPLPFKELFQKQFQHTKEIHLQGNATRMDLVNGDIWIPIPVDKVIQIFVTHGNELKKIKLQCSPYSVKEALNGDIILASDTGLHIVDNDGRVVFTVVADISFCDISILDNKVAALSHTKMQIHSVTFEHGKWTQGKTITTDYNDSSDTIVLCNKFILVTANFWLNESICKYNETKTKCIKIKDYSGRYPFICGSDSDSNVLVSFSDQSVLSLLQPDGQWQDVSIQGSGAVYDVISGIDGSVWVIQCLKGQYKLTQYTY